MIRIDSEFCLSRILCPSRVCDDSDRLRVLFYDWDGLTDGVFSSCVKVFCWVFAGHCFVDYPESSYLLRLRVGEDCIVFIEVFAFS